MTFFWGHSLEIRGMHLVSWDYVCKLKKLGGLGLTIITERMNISISKLVVQLILNPDTLWA